MSWAKHDIEGWEAVCFEGVWTRMCKAFPATIHPLTKALNKQALQDIMDSIDAAPVWDALLEWAHAEIESASAEYLLSDTRPDAYRPVPNDGKVNPLEVPGCSRQEPVTATSGRDGPLK